MKRGVAFARAMSYAKQVFAYTNHTVMPEALEKWDLSLVASVSPEIEKILKNAEVADEDASNKGTANLGCKVTVIDMEFDDEIEFKLVGSTEAKSLENKISNESPIGKALIGKQAGDIVEVDTPAGTAKYKIVKITRD